MTAGNDSEQAATPCPACSPETPTVHTVLKPGGHATVRCRECGHVHKQRLPETGATTLAVIISQDGESLSTSIERQRDAELAVGDEFIVEAEAGVFTVETTALELADESRPQQATAADVRTVWTRAVGNVSVPVTVHPQPGTGHRQDSYSATLQLPGEYTVTVGEEETVADTTVTVEGIHRRAGEGGDRKLDSPGAAAPAKEVERIYARDQERVRSPWG